MRIARWSPRLVLALALLAVLQPPPPHAAAATACGGTVSDAGGGWLTIAPPFASGTREVKLAAAPAFAPDLIYASNGAVVLRTTDGGCSWSKVFGAGAGAAVTALLAPSSATNSRYLYVATATPLRAGASRPEVHVSSREGAAGSWVVASAPLGLPPVGEVLGLAANPVLPTSGYAVVTTGVGAASRRLIHVTDDGGATWSLRTPPYDEFPGSDLVAHPSRQTELFARDGSRFLHSADGGASFQAAGPAVRSLSAAPGGGGVRLVAVSADGSSIERSADGGATWSRTGGASPVSGAIAVPLQDLVVSVEAGRVRARLGVNPAVDRSPSGGPVRLEAASAPTATGFSVLAVRAGRLLRLVLGYDLLPAPVIGANGELRPVRISTGGTRTGASILAPPQLTVSLPTGASRVVPYRLLVPRTPTPVDAMFLVDTTGSMSPTIDGLRQSLARIVSALDTAGLDARFGLGDFRDYPGSPTDNGNWPYKLVRRIGPASGMAAAINTLEAGYGTDGPESQLAALLQSTTGQGQRPWIAPGQQAGYRAGAVRLAFLATDAEFHRSDRENVDDYYRDENNRTSPWPGPEFRAVMAALRAHQVHQIGLAVSNEARPDLIETAVKTKTLAPAGGVDCNGDGAVDVKSAAPLVCDVGDGTPSAGVGVSVDGSDPTAGANPRPPGLAQAVVSLANGIPDLHSVSLKVAAGAARAKIVSGDSTRVLDLKQDNDATYGLRLTCPVAPAASYPIGLRASARGRTLASAGLQLRCGGPPSRPVPGEAAAAPVAAAAAPAAAPAAAQPAPQPNPNPNPNPNPQVNAQLNPNAGLVGQEETQPQLALASDSAHSGQDLEQALLLASSLLLTATALIRRRQLACAPNST